MTPPSDGAMDMHRGQQQPTFKRERGRVCHECQHGDAVALPIPQRQSAREEIAHGRRRFLFVGEWGEVGEWRSWGRKPWCVGGGGGGDGGSSSRSNRRRLDECNQADTRTRACAQHAKKRGESSHLKKGRKRCCSREQLLQPTGTGVQMELNCT